MDLLLLIVFSLLKAVFLITDTLCKILFHTRLNNKQSTSTANTEPMRSNLILMREEIRVVICKNNAKPYSYAQVKCVESFF